MSKLNELTIVESLVKLRSKEISSLDLTKACLESIEKQDKSLNAFVTVLRDDALDTAKRLDQSKDYSLPLAGVPIALKDNFLTIGQRTTASSKVLDNYLPQYDSTVTARLRQAGAIIIGKTNMDAWAHGSSTETSDYGPSRNPHDQDRLPGGSSGGSAVAVAAHEVIGAIGSETAGSIRQPASWCGIVGFKPTYGRVSRYGVIAMGSSLDSPGPMTKSVKDAALLLSVIAGHDPFDATSLREASPDFFTKLKPETKGLRIGLPKEYFMAQAMPGVNALVKKAAARFTDLGAELVEISLLDPKYSIADYTIIQRSEVSSNLARFDGIRYGNNRSFFGKEAKRRIMLGTYALSSGYYDAYYKRALQVRMLLKQDFDRVFNEVDLILAPTTPSTALHVGDSLNQAMFGELADQLLEACALCGLTGISIPVGKLNGLPVGMQLVAPQLEEQKVLNAAFAFEERT